MKLLLSLLRCVALACIAVVGALVAWYTLEYFEILKRECTFCINHSWADCSTDWSNYDLPH